MKVTTVLGMGLAGVMASVFMGGNALAASTVVGGAACHYYDGNDVSNIEYLSYGVLNTSTIANNVKKVVCPVTKQSSNFGGLTVKVNLDSNGPRTVSCTLYGYDVTGKAMGLNTVSNRTSGKESLMLKLPTSTPRSYFSVVCKLPSNEASVLYSVESLN
ncbi:hypothetical protein [Crenothrix polyspora]|uniref:Spore coat protein U domain-containing protein n=1 Tax=Crenothrix polyspora TaxID=360316 RepID=A0A1R4H693_9GAMM|nr:hypothetical protein [Crenothrix polyspora]SJM91762.1 conserved exported hypothetical protein [Crenothrix polyspora]